MPHPAVRLVATAVLLAACSGGSSSPNDAAMTDGVPRGVDAGLADGSATPGDAPPMGELGPGPDAVVPVDAPMDAPNDAPPPPDQAKPHDAKPGDLSVQWKGDLAGCNGGFLNSDAGGDPCPLKCSPLVESVEDEGSDHIDVNKKGVWMHNPPASGQHWGIDRIYGKHDEVVPAEWWVHDLEHGGVVFLYNCPNGCPDVVALFVKLMSSFPMENFDDLFMDRRILITPDPTLPKKIGAVAWDWSYVSDTLDEAALDCFLHARYGHGVEDFP